MSFYLKLTRLKLTHEMFALLQEKGIRKLSLTVKPVNRTAIALYRNVGFESGEMQDAYFDKGGNMMVLTA